MKQLTLILLIGSFSVVIFDTIGSLASRKFGFSYSYLLIGSLLIYAIVGFIATKYNGLMFAPLAGGITGFIDSTLGWYISWAIGPCRPAVEVDANYIFTAILFVVVLSTIFGLVGGFTTKLF